MASIAYSSAVGILVYVMVCTRPNITQAVEFLSQFMDNPRHQNWVVVKRIFRYFRVTTKYFICYHSNVSWDPHSLDIQSYVDPDWVRDVEKRRFASGYVFILFGGGVGKSSDRLWFL